MSGLTLYVCFIVHRLAKTLEKCFDSFYYGRFDNYAQDICCLLHMESL